ncbi:MAG: hypothetical protein FWC26_13170 [Fibromonadales bacterium]|nr:hypothetical protein [Fibromonadales bacterium]
MNIISFVGEANAVVDANGRVSLPSTFRDILPEGEKKFYLATGKGSALMLFRESYYNEVIGPKIMAMSTEDRINAAKSAQFVVLDEKQNRFLLPKKFKEHAKMEKDVVFVGAIDKILIYASEIYDHSGRFEYDL